MIKQIVLGVAALALVTAIGGVGSAHAGKVDCAKVMTEVGAGKKTKDIAKEMSISTSSVYRCKSKAKTKAKAAGAASPAAVKSPSSHS
ncbi:MAG TPA: phage terminase small subunit-related protein [Candidatus Binataceae bacterium]|nr:phage terminase small subunit-related protein [Candidatus Binataceae bacterium]